MALRNDLALPSLAPPPAPAIGHLPAPPARLLPLNRHRPIVHLPLSRSTDDVRTSLAEHHLVGFEEQIAMLASGRYVGISAFGRRYQHMRNHARRLNAFCNATFCRAGCNSPPTTAVRVPTHQLKRQQSLAAYGPTPWATIEARENFCPEPAVLTGPQELGATYRRANGTLLLRTLRLMSRMLEEQIAAVRKHS